MRVSRRKNQGFTLAELLIVVAIIAVLAAIAFPVFSAQLTKAKLAVDIAHYRTMETYDGILQAFGELTVGGVTVQFSTRDRQVYCFLNDGTLSEDIWMAALHKVPENAYRAKASSDKEPIHNEGDVLVLMLDHDDLTPNVRWLPPVNM